MTTKELFTGLLWKCGGKVKSWNKRFFILKDDYCLYYYKDTCKGPLGAISLRDTKFKVRKGEPSDASWPKSAELTRSFVVVTNQRTYCMFAESREEGEMWVRILEGARDKLLSESLEPRTLSIASTISSSVSTEESLSKIPPDLNETTQCGPTLTPPTSGGIERQLTYEEMHPAQSDTEAPEAFYDFAKPMPELSTREKGSKFTENPDAVYAQAMAIEPVDIYEEVVPENSIQSQPLPALPKVVATDTPQSLYEDMGEQPLYDSVNDKKSVMDNGHDTVQEIEDSGDFTVTNGAPPLPAKDDLPPLPPRNDLPPLPPRNESEQMKDQFPPLPPKGSPITVRGPPPPESPAYYDDVTEISKEMNKLHLSELENGSPITIDKVNDDSQHTSPPSHSTSPSHGTPPSQSTPPSHSTQPSHSTPPSHGTPPSPSKQSRSSLSTPPPGSPASHITSPSPHRPLTPPIPRARIKTPPSPQPSSPHTAHTVHSTGSPPSPRRTSPKPSPIPRRKSQSIPAPPEPLPRQRNETQKSPLSPNDKGRSLFHSRAERLAELSAGDSKRRADTVQLMTSDLNMSADERSNIAKTLREVEQERLLASEERFKFERERMKFEEERRKFEQERQMLQQQLEAAKKQLDLKS